VEERRRKKEEGRKEVDIFIHMYVSVDSKETPRGRLCCNDRAVGLTPTGAFHVSTQVRMG
jgi:hypothetical protein